MQPQSSVFRHRARLHEEAENSRANAGVISEATEEENNEIMRALLGDVRSVRHKFTAMGEEVRRQNTLLESLDAVFARTRVRLGRTLRQLDVAGVTSVTHMWVLFVFVIVVFMLIYFMLKFG
ncbi:putative Golgi vesicular membrane trafficking protein [Trypanosoma cruzi]|uniref:Golgi vesicular membrane trafficking protein, putative n=2 Tax=Trypanosoma cruzi TaxID=5693 RepID=Q4DWA2_TRYCC|nr:Golgi vesicular membrane trafficking protein, putative [Trypanosoma cruzi]PBJ72919.1 Golgi vesicular membrane trafficking protein [Trypanosoma cruzi cruzi]EAN96788.1 Golgi vesicular membrane trafficking protein, putative [Trypanosoma cruzi]KAF8276209.1 putative Golgi vesicular membrane trafficking protein [Trypanosoma cruzi]PWU99000.1 putative Golgi vesicular membrane trafficking protein [Trypanosoma cruzi]PWV12932.1 putative Golgi vesicular membrane trafficking protein [Trypanosoma cruzi]|eukprot:XP_818639.1 Golgi vesicular membrane trafficking protein [Trypanosoma cruzi strain CL Brener]